MKLTQKFPFAAILFFLLLLYNKVIYSGSVLDDKDKPLCTPLLKSKSSAPKDAFDLTRVSSNITAKRYESVAQFDADMNAVFSSVTREHGRMSALGGIAVTLKKVCTVNIDEEFKITGIEV